MDPDYINTFIQAEFVCFKKDVAISTLNNMPQEVVDKFKCPREVPVASWLKCWTAA